MVSDEISSNDRSKEHGAALRKECDEIKAAIRQGKRVHTQTRQFLFVDFGGLYQDFQWSVGRQDSSMTFDEFQQFLYNVEILERAADETSRDSLKRVFNHICQGKPKLSFYDLIAFAALPTSDLEQILIKLQNTISHLVETKAFTEALRPYTTSSKPGDEAISTWKFYDLLRDCRCLHSDNMQLTASEVEGIKAAVQKGYAVLTLGTLRGFRKQPINECFTHPTAFSYRSLTCDPFSVVDVVKSDLPVEGYFAIGGGFWCRVSNQETEDSAFVSDVAIAQGPADESQLILDGYQLVRGQEQGTKRKRRNRRLSSTLWMRQSRKGDTVVGVFVSPPCWDKKGAQTISMMPPSQGFRYVGVIDGSVLWQRKLDTRNGYHHVDKITSSMLRNLNQQARGSRRIAKLKSRIFTKMKRRFMVLEETGKRDSQLDTEGYLCEEQIRGELCLEKFHLLLKKLGSDLGSSRTTTLYNAVRKSNELLKLHDVQTLLGFNPKRMSRFVHRMASLGLEKRLSTMPRICKAQELKEVLDQGFKGIFYENNLTEEMTQLLRLLQGIDDDEKVNVGELNRLIQAHHNQKDNASAGEQQTEQYGQWLFRSLSAFVKYQYDDDPDRAYSALVGSTSKAEVSTTVLAQSLSTLPCFQAYKKQDLIAYLENSVLCRSTGEVSRQDFKRHFGIKKETVKMFEALNDVDSTSSEDEPQSSTLDNEVETAILETPLLSEEDWSSILEQISKNCDLRAFAGCKYVDLEEFKTHVLSKIAITESKACAMIQALEHHHRIRFSALKRLLPLSKPCSDAEAVKLLRTKLAVLLKSAVNRGIKLAKIYCSMFDIGFHHELTLDAFAIVMVRLFGQLVAKDKAVSGLFRSIATPGETVIRFEDIYQFYYFGQHTSHGYKDKLQWLLKSKRIHIETFRSSFEKLDTKGTGTVSSHSARQILNRLRPWLKPFDIDAVIFDYGKAMGKFDYSSFCGVFKCDEINDCLDVIRCYIQKHCIDCFAAFAKVDPRNRGTVPCSDFRDTLHHGLRLKSFLTEQALSALVRTFADTEAQQPVERTAPEINYVDFYRAVAPTAAQMKSAQQKIRRRLESVAALRGGKLNFLSSFRAYDENYTGFISCSDFKHICENYIKERVFRKREVLMLQHFYSNALGKVAYRDVCEFLMPEVGDPAHLLKLVKHVRQVLICKQESLANVEWVDFARARETLGLDLPNEDIDLLVRLFAPRTQTNFSLRGFRQNILRACAPGGFVYSLQKETPALAIHPTSSATNKLDYKRVANSLRAFQIETR